MQKLFCFFSGALLVSSTVFCQSGSLDSTFNEDGIVVTDIGVNTNDFLYGMAIQQDQKILAVGSVNIGGNVDFAVIRYLPDGSQDPDFGSNGIVRVDFAAGDDACHAIVLQPDGKYLFAGKTNAVDLKNQWLLARVTNAGELDTDFGDNGFVVTDMASNYQVANSMILQNDSRIVLGGWNGDFNNSDFTLARYFADSIMTSGVKGLIKDFTFSISPNPCKDFISIALDKEFVYLQAFIVDASGRLIKSEVVNPGGSGKITLNVNQLSNGHYHIWLRDGNKWGSAAFVVAR